MNQPKQAGGSVHSKRQGPERSRRPFESPPIMGPAPRCLPLLRLSYSRWTSPLWLRHGPRVEALAGSCAISFRLKPPFPLGAGLGNDPGVEALAGFCAIPFPLKPPLPLGAGPGNDPGVEALAGFFVIPFRLKPPFPLGTGLCRSPRVEAFAGFCAIPFRLKPPLPLGAGPGNGPTAPFIETGAKAHNCV